MAQDTTSQTVRDTWVRIEVLTQHCLDKFPDDKTAQEGNAMAKTALERGTK